MILKEIYGSWLCYNSNLPSYSLQNLVNIKFKWRIFYKIKPINQEYYIVFNINQTQSGVRLYVRFVWYLQKLADAELYIPFSVTNTLIKRFLLSELQNLKNCHTIRPIPILNSFFNIYEWRPFSKWYKLCVYLIWPRLWLQNSDMINDTVEV